MRSSIRLSSEKCFINYVQIFLAGCLARWRRGEPRLGRAEAPAGAPAQADIFGNYSQVRNVLTSSFGASGIGRCNVRAEQFPGDGRSWQPGTLNVDTFRIAALRESASVDSVAVRSAALRTVSRRSAWFF